MLEHFCKYLIAEKRYSEHTVNAYRTDIANFFEFSDISPDNVAEINHQIIRGWISFLLNEKKQGTKLSSRSVNRKIAALRSFYNYLRRKGIVQHNPLSKIVNPKITKQLPIFFKEDKLNNYLDKEKPEDNYESIRDTAILEVLYGTGIRVSELVNLQCNDIDFSNKTIKISGKGNKQRYIPVSAHLETILKDYLLARAKYFPDIQLTALFLTPKYKQIYTKLVYLIVHRQLTAGGFTEKRSPHVLRHSFATHLLNHEADLNGIKELLGHANLSATQVYTHNSFQKMKAIYKKAHPHADNEGE
jgi:integrase/recombinase XerC